MSQVEDKVVLFLDILGFESLVESCPIDPELYRAADLPLSRSIDTLLKASNDPLVHAFAGFHSTLKWTLFTAGMRHRYTAITFSDSTFIATSCAFEAANIAVELSHSLLSNRIPARIGIAFGSLATFRFKSDITSEGGDHACQFLGTAVTRAVAAEKCGIGGMRILLHPSMIPLMEDPRHNPRGDGNSIRLIPCSETETVNKAGVRYEIDYWHLAPTKEASAWKGLQDMWSKAPLSEDRHYRATAEAINRMRIARGCAPLEELRRRTLPRSRPDCRIGGRK